MESSLFTCTSPTKNKTDKDIQGVKGVLHVNDLFGDKIVNVRWSYDRGVPANKRAVETGSGLELNRFIDSHMKLWTTDFDKIKSNFEVQTIIFKGSSSRMGPESMHQSERPRMT
jgi:hypothetical protein